MASKITVHNKIWKDAWKFSIFNFKIIILAFFAFLLSDVGIYRSLIKYFDVLASKYSSVITVGSLKSYILDLLHVQYWLNLFPVSPVFVGFLLLILLIFFFALYYLSINSQIAILEAIKYYIQDFKDKIKISNLFAKAQNKFWPVFTINIVRQVMVWFLGGVIAVPLLVYLYSYNLYLFWLLFLALLFVLLLINFISLYSINYIVFYNKGLVASIKKAEHLFSAHFWTSIEVAFILFLLELVVGFLVYGLSKFLLLSLLLVGFANNALLMLSLLVLVVVFLLASIYLLVWYYAYQLAVWAFLFLLLQDEDADKHAVVIRVFKYIKIIK